jgi:hypothetical protein
VRRGYESARGRYILQIDSNGAFEPEELAQLWEARFDRHLVLARRVRRIETVGYEVLTRLFLRVARLLFSSQLLDPESPFRLFRRDAALPLLGALPAGFSTVNLALSLLMEHEFGTQVAEVSIPVSLPRRKRHRRSMTGLLGSGFRKVSELFQLRFEILRTTRVDFNAVHSLK